MLIMAKHSYFSFIRQRHYIKKKSMSLSAFANCYLALCCCAVMASSSQIGLSAHVSTGVVSPRIVTLFTASVRIFMYFDFFLWLIYIFDKFLSLWDGTCLLLVGCSQVVCTVMFDQINIQPSGTWKLHPRMKSRRIWSHDVLLYCVCKYLAVSANLKPGQLLRTVTLIHYNNVWILWRKIIRNVEVLQGMVLVCAGMSNKTQTLK